jgi:cell division protein FtsB
VTRSGRALGHVLRRLAAPVAILVVAGSVVSLGVFPARTYLDQRQAIAAAQTQLDDLTNRNEALQREVEILDDDAEIERLARQEYGLARPGEEIYQVLPPPEDPLRVPDVWPFNRLDRQLGR